MVPCAEGLQVVVAVCSAFAVGDDVVYVGGWLVAGFAGVFAYVLASSPVAAEDVGA